MSGIRQPLQPARVLLACFVAQGAWFLLTLFALAATLFAVVGGGEPERDFVDLLIDGSQDVAGVSTTVLGYLIALVSVLGLLLVSGAFIVPMLIRIFLRIICGASVSYAWALVANLASWIVMVALSILLWVLPGGQPFAAFFVWIGSSVMTALLVQPRLRTTAIAPTKIDPDRAAPADTDDGTTPTALERKVP
jgi:hypothetical protein